LRPRGDLIDQAFLVALALEVTAVPANPHAPVHERMHVLIPSEGEVAPENHAAATQRNGYNGSGRLRHKRKKGLHGVLLQRMPGFFAASN
jgi:hypothetical protein